MHTTEFFEKVGTHDSAVGCTPRSQTDSKMFPFFVFSYLLRLSTPLKKKTEIKEIPLTICDLQYQFCINIFRHHREIAFGKLQI